MNPSTSIIFCLVPSPVQGRPCYHSTRGVARIPPTQLQALPEAYVRPPPADAISRRWPGSSPDPRAQGSTRGDPALALLTRREPADLPGAGVGPQPEPPGPSPSRRPPPFHARTNPDPSPDSLPRPGLPW